MIKILNPIDISPILESYQKLEKDLQWTDFGHKGRQVGLQYKEGEDHWTSAVGKSRGEELTYSILNPFFKNTIFEEIINNYNFRRTRLMWVGPYACYSLHVDTTPRVHIPLVTNKDCYFVFKQGRLVHLRLGYATWVDTTKPHTFMNCSNEHRLHLVGVVENT